METDTFSLDVATTPGGLASDVPAGAAAPWHPTPYHWSSDDLWLFWLGVILGVLGICALAAQLLSRRTAADEPAVDIAPPRDERARWRLVFWPLGALWLMLQTRFAASNWLLISGDEYSRIGHSFAWANEPYFATFNHVWLAGHFYLLGGLFSLIGDMRTVILLSSGAAILGMMYWGGGLAVRLWQSLPAGLLTATLIGSHWIVLWGAVNPIADLFFYTSMLFIFDRFAAWRLEGEQRRPNALLAMGAAAGFGNLFRFEAWYLGIPLGVFLLVMAALAARQRRDAWHVAAPVLGALLNAAYPIAHVISSKVKLGAFTAFLSIASEMNDEGNLFYDLDTPLARFLLYPVTMWDDHWYLMPLVIGGLVVALWRRENRQRTGETAAAIAVLWVVSMLICIKSGIGSNTRPRYTLFLLLPLYAFAAAPILELARLSTSRHWQRTVAALILATGAASAWVTVHKAYFWYPSGFDFKLGDVALVAVVEQERQASRRWDGEPKVHVTGGVLAVYTADRDYYPYDYLRYHSPDPSMTQWVADEDLLRYILNDPVHWRSVAVRGGLPDGITPGPEFRVIFQEGEWQVWQADVQP